ncbi:HAD-like domain-containing protein [Scenedesmus sp. NREL 46B-D3]|nr:HAD-like domain-containing protein [Scenedesmus sp. NREL 46B-D3]
MKRKSGQHQPSKRKKSSDAAAIDGVTVREGPGFTRLTLPPGQGVVLSGCAVLEVVSGYVRVFGALVTPDHGRVRLTAPARHGRALLISAVPAQAQAPLAQPTVPVQAVLHSINPAAGAAAGGALTFSVVDAASAHVPAAWQAPQPWMQAAEAVAEAAAAAAAAGEPLVVAVTGCKGCGKSAAARLLANSLISASSSSGGVVYMDLDPGQPELTPAGLLSLHMLQQPLFGPSHMQQQEPLLAFFQGDVSSQSEPGRYLQAVQELCSRYYSMAAAAAAAQQPPPPLVINTPGWITGLGLELLAEALRCAGPSHVIDVRSPNSKKNLPDGCWWVDGAAASAAAAAAAVPAVLQVPSVAAAAAAAAAADGGADTPAKAAVAAAGSCFSMQSVFHLPVNSSTTMTPAPLPLYCMRLSVLMIGDTATTVNPGGSNSKAGRALSATDARALSWLAWDVSVELQHAQVQQSELPLALNGAIVGLGSSSSCPAGAATSQGQQGVAALGPQLRQCLGVGLGKRLVFVTNNSTKSRAGYLGKFTGLGLNVNAEEIYSSSYAAAAYLESINFNKKVYVIGESGILEELDLKGIRHLGGPGDADKVVALKKGEYMEHDEDVGAVVVGFDRYINYYKIQDAVTHLTDAQEWAGNGSMVGAIAGSTKQEPITVGKPAEFMLDNIARTFGLQRQQICMVGDRLDTDILFGKNGGLTTCLVLSGVTDEETLLSPDNTVHPDYYMSQLSELLAVKEPANATA